LAELLSGFELILNIPTLIIIFMGVSLGIIVGAIPGLTSTMALALCIPISYAMDTTHGTSLLVSVGVGGVSGGLIAAILLGIPGTPSAVATTFDGYPMAQKGEAGKALGAGIVFSYIGGMLSVLALVTIAPALAKFALHFSAFEYFALILFSLTLVSNLSSGSIIKAWSSALLGMAFSTVGSAPIDGMARFTFGIPMIQTGLNILPVMVGLYAVTEIFMLSQNKDIKNIEGVKFKESISGFGFSLKEFFEQVPNMFRSMLIGLGIGILPGIGSGTSNIVAYSVSKKYSKHPEKYGTGILDGVVASESANNASQSGALIPLLSLGIPGDTATAILLGGLLLHGLKPGPLLFQTSGDIMYGIFATIIIAYIFMLILEFFGLRIIIKVLKIPKYILMPIIIMLCFVGAFALRHFLFDVWILIFFGFIGYILKKFKFPLPPLILGFILGGFLETYLRRGLMFSRGSFLPFFTRPIPAIFYIIIIGTFVFSFLKNKRTKRSKMV
jgi:putative tricarboxylic transport membrane protein